MTPERPEDNAQVLAAYKAGQIDQRLANMDEHFAIINGSIAESAIALTDLATALTEVKTTIKLTGAAIVVLLPLVVAVLLYFN